jgi:hypothetical protein
MRAPRLQPGSAPAARSAFSAASRHSRQRCLPGPFCISCAREYAAAGSACLHAAHSCVAEASSPSPLPLPQPPAAAAPAATPERRDESRQTDGYRMRLPSHSVVLLYQARVVALPRNTGRSRDGAVARPMQCRRREHNGSPELAVLRSAAAALSASALLSTQSLHLRAACHEESVAP